MSIIQFIKRGYKWIRNYWKHLGLKNIHKTAKVHYSVLVNNPDNLIMAEQTSLDGGAIIMNDRAKLIFKRNSGAAVGFTAIPGNHMSVVGKNLKQVDDRVKDELDINKEMDKDILIEEDVWIGTRVTLLSGAHLGRGCEVGAGSVVRGSTPPYSVVIGNPCKV